MTEKSYKYTAKFKQPQRVVNVKLDPKGGVLSEREYKTVKKDAYGTSLLEKGLLVVEEATDTAPNVVVDQSAAAVSSNKAKGDGETVPDFEAEDASKDLPEDHAGWKPE